MKLHTLVLSLIALVPFAALRGVEGKKIITNSIGMKLVRIEPGSFMMGQDGPPVAGKGDMAMHHAEFWSADWDEKPAHKVTITQPFRMGVTEVTVAQYRQFDPGFKTSDPTAKPADDDAASGITWEMAVEFCEWLSKKEGKTCRLPTEAEWEYACRAGSMTLSHTGDTLPAGHQQWFGRLCWHELYFPDGKMPPEYGCHNGAPSLRVASTHGSPAAAAALPFDRGEINRYSVDQIPRSLSIRQGGDVWLAYDLERATVFKVWRAPVGRPGLIAKGFTVASSGTALFEDRSAEPWRLLRNGKPVTPLTGRYLGCTQRETHFELSWEVRHGAGRVVLHERLPRDSAGVVVRREWRVESLGAGDELQPPAPLRAVWRWSGPLGTSWQEIALR